MKLSIKLWQWLGFGVTSLGGTLLHFLYDWFSGAIWVAPISSINESTWEHMKLLFWPMFIFAIVQSFFLKNHQNFWCVKLRGIVLGIISIPIIFYTYNGAIAKSPDWINITIFFLCAAISYIYEIRLFNNNKIQCVSSKFAFSILCVISLLFVIFTFQTPEIGIFMDPLSGTYGM